MTMLEPGSGEGRLQTVIDEKPCDDGAAQVTLAERSGVIHADLSIGANVAGAVKLEANSGLSVNGMMLAGRGFIVDDKQAQQLRSGSDESLHQHLRPIFNGRDITDAPRGMWVLDFYGWDADDLRAKFPQAYQWLHERVKPERDQNNRPRLRELWWVFAEPRKTLRAALAGLPRYIATVETAKHRLFQFLDAAVLPEHKLIAIALDDAFSLGVLSSRVHTTWALAVGSRLGVGNDPVYSKSTCFDTFPFPAADTGLTPALAQRIGQLAEKIDAHRKRQQAAHADVTLTGMYNVLEKLRAGAELNAKEKALNERAFVGVLLSLHDELDAAVLQAYGWQQPGLLADVDRLLQKLVDLNVRRAAEEAQGLVRWLRPAFQQPAATVSPAPAADAPEAVIAADPVPEPSTVAAPAPAALDTAPEAGIEAPAAAPWPKAMPAQISAVQALLSARPQSVDALAARFRRRPAKAVREVLDTLLTLGLAHRSDDDGWSRGG